jgi:hypothetical protein
MKRPVVYLSKVFLEKIDECEPIFRAKRGNPETGEFIPAELKTLERIVVLLLSGELLTDYDDKEAVKLFKKAATNQLCASFRELIIKQAIKQDRLHHNVAAFTRYTNAAGEVDANNFTKLTIYQNASYFLPSNQQDCNAAASKTGLAVVGTDFDFKDFFTAATISNYATSSQLHELEKVAHKGNGLVIIDKYILQDSTTFEEKLPNIISTIKKFMPSTLDGKFELTIITKHNQNDTIARHKVDELLDALGGSEHISFKLIAPQHMQEGDRYILSNYLSITIGHPYDRASVLSSSCIISQEAKEKLQEAYKTWYMKLQLAKQITAHTRANPRHSFVFETDSFEHRLLNLH